MPTLYNQEEVQAELRFLLSGQAASFVSCGSLCSSALMVGWHHPLSGHESEQNPGDGEGHGSLACCGLWGHKESDTTERLSWIDLSLSYFSGIVFFISISAN